MGKVAEGVWLASADFSFPFSGDSVVLWNPWSPGAWMQVLNFQEETIKTKHVSIVRYNHI